MLPLTFFVVSISDGRKHNSGPLSFLLTVTKSMLELTLELVMAFPIPLRRVELAPIFIGTPAGDGLDCSCLHLCALMMLLIDLPHAIQSAELYHQRVANSKDNNNNILSRLTNRRGFPL